MDNIIGLFSSGIKEDFIIGLHLLDRYPMEEIMKFFSDKGDLDPSNYQVTNRPSNYRLNYHTGINTFNIFSSRHGFWYVSQLDYTFLTYPCGEERINIAHQKTLTPLY